MTTRTISSIKVVSPPSPPDIDSDFDTRYREKVYEYVSERYGKENVANIITFGTFKAKNSFKNMCTIYNKPFVEANRISALIPSPVEGRHVSIADIFDETHERYLEGADFRDATSDPDWQEIVEFAGALNNRIREVGVHACGVIMSSEPLSNNIPMMMRQADGRLVTQWTYPECESIGLIKMDFLGLDTIDLIDRCIGYVRKSGKKCPSFDEVIAGELDDKKTYAMLQRGESVGLFQVSGEGMQDLLARLKPTVFEDIVAVLALFRPGPMGMGSHNKYADRKNGLESVDYVLPEFADSPLKEILKETYGIVLYQEQVMQIANRIGGFTLAESDNLRKAMGKKKIEYLNAAEDKFISGGIERGWSKPALQHLWNIIYQFGQYGFNKSHSVAYALSAYMTAYLKANFPVEFLAALISQNIGKKDKILEALKEATRMGITVGGIDVNNSDVYVAPDFSGESGFDILYGLSGLGSISVASAEVIVKEREKNGLFAGVEDFISRTIDTLAGNKKVYESIAVCGGFDTFGFTRKSIVDNLPSMIRDAKDGRFTTSLFDFGESESLSTLSTTDEYLYVDKLRLEAENIGFYLSGHPLKNLEYVRLFNEYVSLADFLANTDKSDTQNKCFVTVTNKEVKVDRKGNKSVYVVVDDGRGNFLDTKLSKQLIEAIDKGAAANKQSASASLYGRQDGIPDKKTELGTKTNLDTVEPLSDIEINNVYEVDLRWHKTWGNQPARSSIFGFKKVRLSRNGTIPLVIRVLASAGTPTSLVAGLKKRFKTVGGGIPVFFEQVECLGGDVKYRSRGPVFYIDMNKEIYSELEKTLGTDFFNLSPFEK